MDFFTSQDQARKKTGRLIILFIIAVIIMIAVLHVVTATAITMIQLKTQPDIQQNAQYLTPYLNPLVFAAVTVATLLIVFLGSAYKTAQLSAGGHVVAEMLGGKLIQQNTSDLNERKVLNVVEEMAIASGVPVPPVYLMNQEKGINAFAAGFSQKDAVISVTRGTIAILSRDELQGVIGHEFSHILNGDMRMNIRLIGILNGILVIGMMGYFIMRFLPFTGGRRSSSSKDSGNGMILVAILMVSLAMIVVGFVGLFFGNLIKAAVSRQREFLADASSVQFTRNPDGIAGALQKIGGYTIKSKIDNPNAPQSSHMFFSDGMFKGVSGMLATHPPLPERIKRILPSWDGTFKKVALPAVDTPERAAIRKSKSQTVRETITRGPLQGKPLSKQQAFMGGLAGAGLLDMIGRPTPAHVDYATQLIKSIPDELKQTARDIFGSRAIVLALLLDPNNKSCREKQLASIQSSPEPGLYEMTARILPLIDQLGKKYRLPLIDLSLPALRSMSPRQYDSFSKLLQQLIEADNRVDLFEWSLQRILKTRLSSHYQTTKRRKSTQYYGLQRLQKECAVVLSVLAHAGAKGNQKEATKAFAAGAQALNSVSITFMNREDISWEEIDNALAKLDLSAPPLKKQLIHACAKCAAADQIMTEEEAELLRAFADGLEVPIPPMLPGQPVS